MIPVGKSIFLTALIIIIVGLGAFAIGYLTKGQNQFTITPTQTIMPSPTPSATLTPTTSPTPTPISSANIRVFAPHRDEAVSSSFTLSGEARVFENALNYRLKDPNDKVLSQGNLMAEAPDTGLFGPFEKKIYFTTNTSNGTLEVFSYSAKDGSEINKVVIPLRFSH